jgi:IS30 family transposase
MGQKDDSIGKRKWKQLTEKDRYKIEALSKQGISAVEIGRSFSPTRDRRTIEREIKRGLTEQRDSELRERHVYLADAGQRVHEENAAKKG